MPTSVLSYCCSVLKNFANFTGKQPQERPYFRKAAGLSKTSLQVFSEEFRELFRNSFFTGHLWATVSVCPLNSQKYLERASPDSSVNDPVHTGRKLNVRKTFTRRPGSLLNVLRTFKLHHVSTREVAKRDPRFIRTTTGISNAREI